MAEEKKNKGKGSEIIYPKGVLITCEDYRLHQRQDGRNYIAHFSLATKCECDLITRAGGVLDLVSPQDTGINFDQSLLRDAKVSTKLHNAKCIYLVGHENCAAYRYLNLSTREAERMRIERDLNIARNILRSQFKGSEVRIYFAELKKDSHDIFEIQEIN